MAQISRPIIQQTNTTKMVLANGILIFRFPKRKLMSPGSLPSPNFESLGTDVMRTMRSMSIVRIQRIRAL